MNNEVIAQLDISTPTGRKIVRELEKYKRTVKVEYPLPQDIDENSCDFDEVYEKGLDKLSELYNTDMRLLAK